MISIIVPTYNESKNIEELVKKINQSMQKIKEKFEIIIVDDNSPDKTYDIAKSLEGKYHVRAFCRKKEKGLSSAVVFGFGRAKGDILGVIDADLSHPPEKIPDLIAAIMKGGYDISVGSRLIKGGSVENWPWIRKMISRFAASIARPLTKVTDIMSGFFFIKKEVIKNAKLVPRGYKILLEILVKGEYKKVKEIPYVFKNRELGQSKLNAKIQLEYLIQVMNLYMYKIRRIFSK